MFWCSPICHKYKQTVYKRYYCMMYVVFVACMHTVFLPSSVESLSNCRIFALFLRKIINFCLLFSQFIKIKTCTHVIICLIYTTRYIALSNQLVSALTFNHFHDILQSLNSFNNEQISNKSIKSLFIKRRL